MRNTNNFKTFAVLFYGHVYTYGHISQNKITDFFMILAWMCRFTPFSPIVYCIENPYLIYISYYVVKIQLYYVLNCC